MRLRGAIAALALAGGLAAGPAPADVTVQDAWIAEPPPGAPAAAGYLTLVNPGEAPRALVAAASPACERVELHRTRVVDGVARMRPLERLEVPPGGSARLEPGGAHLMLMRPQGLKVGQTVLLELRFADGERLEVQAPVRRREGHGHSHH